MHHIRSFPLILGLAFTLTGQNTCHAWKFLVYGDSRGTSSNAPVETTILAELARVTTNERPAFVLVPGDLVNRGSLWAFQQWTNIMAPVYAAGIPVYPVLGNHENYSDGISGFITIFGPSIPNNGPAGEIDRTYSITYSNALVLCMDNYVNLHRVNNAWISTVLATNKALHVFAQGHEPAFKVNHTDCLDDYVSVRDTFWNSLSNTLCRAYFCGHDHFYDHMRLDDGDGDASNDAHQFIVGTGGAPLYTDAPYNGANSIWTPRRAYHENQYGYLSVEVEGPVATFRFYHRTAANVYPATSDVFTYSLAPMISAEYISGNLRLTWAGGGNLQKASTPNGPWSSVSNGASPYVVTDFSAGAAYYRVRLR